MAEKQVDPPDEEFSVRLSWPKPSEPAPTPPVRPAAEPQKKTRATVRPAAPRIEAPRAGAPAAAPAPTPAPAEAPPQPATYEREARTPEAVDAAAGVDAGAPGRIFVEAFDRLADRLLDRLRTLRQDVDTDLGAVRNEVAALRQAVDDLGERTQVRQVLAGVDEARSELAALRRAVLEWPELEQVSNDIAAMRGDLAFMFESAGEVQAAPPSDLLAELQRTIGTLSDEITRMGETAPPPPVADPSLDGLVQEMAAIRTELTQMRRRVGVRKGPLNDEQLEQIVSAVAARVVEDLQYADDSRRRRR